MRRFGMRPVLAAASAMAMFGFAGAAPASADVMAAAGYSQNGPSIGSRTSPRLAPEEAYAAGVAALDARDYRDAVSYFRRVQMRMPGHVDSNYGLGLAYLGLGQEWNAARALEHAAASPYAPADAHLQLGLLYLADNDRAGAQARVDALDALLADCAASFCSGARWAQLQEARDELALALGL